MKTRIMLTSIMFMLLALPSEAREVYAAVVSERIVENLPTPNDWDLVIKTFAKPLDNIFVAGRAHGLYIDEDETFVMKGGRESIVAALTPYKDFTVVRGSPSSPYLRVYVCRSKKLLEKNTTYVTIESPSFKWKYCQGARMNGPVIKIEDVIRHVESYK